jgi:2-phosphoglycerate kinase
MAQRKSPIKKKKPGSASPQEHERTFVVDGQGRRPFMRGIMVHALMARGISFDDAYRIADRASRRLSGCEEVSRDELGAIVAELLDSGDLGALQPVVAQPASIQITSGRRSVPFSKGVLSQSLLAASIDPAAAFETARDIEMQLLQRRVPRVSRKTLRKVAYQALLDRFGEKTARRFMVWRKHQEPRKPVIILLGGTTGAGKTSIALEVALRLGIRRVLSTDSIRQVMRIVLSEELAPALHTSSFDAHRALNLDASSGSRVVDGFLQQASSVSVGVRAMMDRAVEEHTSLVLDGVSLLPGLIDLDAYKDKAYVIPIVVARLDEDAFRGHFRSRGADAGRRGMKRYLNNFSGILEIQNLMLELADQCDVPIVDNQSVEQSVLLVIRHVVETLREIGDPVELELPYA